MTTGFFEQLEERVAATNSLLCVGLDPRADSPKHAVEHCLAVIEATARHVAAFKPNSAFFEAMGPPGVEALAEAIAAVPDGIPVLLDAKRGDVSSTAAAYATAAFERLGAGAVTVSPYLGLDSIEPFLEHEGRGVFVLCRTSNPGGRRFQEAELGSGDPLYVEVARVAAAWAGPDRLGLVVGATEPDAIARVRGVAPEHWILAPGVGAQGGSLEASMAAGVRSDGAGLLLPVSRAIAAAADPTDAVLELNAAIARARSSGAVAATVAGEHGLAATLFDAGCIRMGDFELKSGRRSPIYLDLRNLSGHPSLLRRVAARYLPLLGGADRLAGVPLAGLPIATAVSLVAGMPMVYARPEAKEHGTGSKVEGSFEPGDRVIVVDDVATGGSSILTAADRLRRAGLEVDSAVVLVDRRGGAAGALAAAGITLRAVTDLPHVVGVLRRSGRITDAEARRVDEFLESG
ncbi:MAG: orotidine-5'-phosphate decarboxylase [Acidimicrobiia bacterium]